MTFTLLLSSPLDQISLPHPLPVVGWTGADDADDADDESTHSSKLFADNIHCSYLSHHANHSDLVSKCLYACITRSPCLFDMYMTYDY